MPSSTMNTTELCLAARFIVFTVPCLIWRPERTEYRARAGRQAVFLAAFALPAWGLRKALPRLPTRDRWFVALVWLIACAPGADGCGLHHMLGAFIAGAVIDAQWFDQHQMDLLRHHVLLVLMPVFFLSTGLRTRWDMPDGSGVPVVFAAATCLLLAAVTGKLAGVHLPGRILKSQPGEASLICWLLQTKALIMIIFASVLLDKGVIAAARITALLFMAVGSTMLTIPMASPMLACLQAVLVRSG